MHFFHNVCYYYILGSCKTQNWTWATNYWVIPFAIPFTKLQFSDNLHIKNHTKYTQLKYHTLQGMLGHKWFFMAIMNAHFTLFCVPDCKAQRRWLKHDITMWKQLHDSWTMAGWVLSSDTICNTYPKAWVLFDVIVIWGLVNQKHVTRAGTSNYIPQYPCPWYLLAHQASYIDMNTFGAAIAQRDKK